jgi:hypothetical protein
MAAHAVYQGVTRKTFYPTKADWAMAKANEARQKARVMSDARAREPGAPRSRDDVISKLFAEASKFDRIADTYRKRGQ